MKRLLGLGFLMALGGLLILRLNVHPVREAYWLIGNTSSLGFVMARLSTSDTGLLRGQITTRVLLVDPGQIPLEHRAQGLSLPVPQGLSTPTDTLIPNQDGWELRIGGTALAGRLHLRQAEGCGQAAGTLNGFLGYDKDVRRVDGLGTLVHTRATGTVDNRALYVFGTRFSAGIDPLSDCPVWWHDAQGSGQGELLPLPGSDRFSLTLGGHQLQVEAHEGVVLQSFLHVLAFERWAAAIAGFPEPYLYARRALVHVEGETLVGVLLQRGSRPLW
jgi:hypothetical protein